MAETPLEDSALSAFFGSMATMIQAGIQTDEAVLMLGENREQSMFQEICARVYDHVIEGDSLSQAMRASKGFPTYAVDMVAMGEESGRLEQVLSNLEVYYDEEARLFDKLRQAISYPAALLLIMCSILAFSTFAVLPVFEGVYEDMAASSLTASSLLSIAFSKIISIFSLIMVSVAAVVALGLALAIRTGSGRRLVVRMLEHLPLTRDAMYQLALSRFTASLAAYLSSGITSEDALLHATRTASHRELRRRLDNAHEAMVSLDNPRSLVQAITENGVFEPLYARMLNVGIRSGSADDALAQFSDSFFDDATSRLDRTLDLIEPFFAACLTISVGVTLVAVMLPLVGVMHAVG